MRRLSDIVFAVMRDKIPYDPDIHRRIQAQGGKNKEEGVAAAEQRQESSAFPSPRGVTNHAPGTLSNSEKPSPRPFDSEDQEDSLSPLDHSLSGTRIGYRHTPYQGLLCARQEPQTS